MSSANVANNPKTQQAATPPVASGAASGPGGIKIKGFPQVLYTRVFGPPDMLFIPLLDAARDAYKSVERLAGQGQDRANSVMMGSAQLASVLLRDVSFTLVATLQTVESLYTVDLDAGTILVQTQLFAVVSRRTSLFHVEIVGKISEGPYTVRNPASGTVIMVVEESRLRQPNSFSTWLSTECLRSQIDQERLGTINKTQEPPTFGEVKLVVAAAGDHIPVTLQQKKEGGGWDIIDGRKKEWVGRLAPDIEGHLNSVISVLQGLFAGKKAAD
ncbi:MAG: hypothetical protein WB780_01255 [Candidatus Acidiferrales bacterium]